MVGNKWAELDKTDSDSALKDGKTVLDNVVLYSSTTSNTTKDEGVAQSGKIAFNVDTPVDFLGKTVTMYIEKTTILSDSKVLGVSTKDDVNVINATAATQSTVKDYLKGTGVAVTKGTEFYVNYGYCKTEEDAHNLINDYSYRQAAEERHCGQQPEGLHRPVRQGQRVGCHRRGHRRGQDRPGHLPLQYQGERRHCRG